LVTDPVVVVGAGWSGAVVAHRLTAAGVAVEVLERAPYVGGHSRVETIGGVVYEPHGPHIFHTSNSRVARFVRGLGIDRPYQFCPLTAVDVDGEERLMSWPIQVDELESLPDWSRISRELDALPDCPVGDDFETYAVSLMGRRLYELFIEGYTRKQWGREPSELSSSFAPKRIDLRRDGRRGLFRDRWQFFATGGVNDAIDVLLRPVAVTCGADVTVDDLAGIPAAGVVVTAALDDFAGRPETLEWRGVQLRSRYVPTEDPTATVTPAYVINRPSELVPYTRTIETKHATGQHVDGTVVSEEYPGAPERHYPVATVDHRYERENEVLASEIRERLAPTPVVFCGRLATYRYINQDEAIEDAWRCADDLLESLRWAGS
jgi:UDP-galactopyranose mutase